MFDVISPFINLIWPILLAIGAVAAAWGWGKSKQREGRAIEAAKNAAEQREANEREMSRVALANKARIDAEARAREGKLTDKYTRKD